MQSFACRVCVCERERERESHHSVVCVRERERVTSQCRVCVRGLLPDPSPTGPEILSGFGSGSG